ncbi:MAG: aspartate aminotransferase family protein [Kiloniellales bacterium]|nr:aspartate aminotransferase family protein [Kiloniellales bacterium]
MPPNNRAKPQLSEGEANTTKRRQDWQAANLGSETKEILRADSERFIHQSVSTPCLTAIRKAEGIWIEDWDGRRYMDFHGNSVHHLGYGHPRLREAIKCQIDDLSFAPRRFASRTALELAEKLAALSPGNLSKMLFTTGGSDAIEVALKIARTATGRFKTLSFWDAFHGAGFGAASLSGESLFRGGAIGPLLPGAEHVAPFACYRCPYGHPDLTKQPDLEICHSACASYVRYVLEKEGDIAALVAEPMRAVPYVAPKGFWKAVKAACETTSTLLIFDEIPTGLGKTGRFFACEHEDVEPDILVLGKALGGGILPIAAAIARPELDQAEDYALGHYTHEKNPVTARAALTTLEIIEEEGLVERAAWLGELALQRLREMQERHPQIGDVRARGLLMGVELVLDKESKDPANELAEEVYYRCLDKGLSFKVTMGNVLTLSPPLVIAENDLLGAMAILEEALLEASPS